MFKVVAISLKTGKRREYSVPSAEVSLAYAKSTYGAQFDKIEGANVRGGLPMLWPLAVAS